MFLQRRICLIYVQFNNRCHFEVACYGKKNDV